MKIFLTDQRKNFASLLSDLIKRPIADTTEMLNLIAQLPPGKKSKITVQRKQQESVIEVQVGKRPKPQRVDEE